MLIPHRDLEKVIHRPNPGESRLLRLPHDLRHPWADGGVPVGPIEPSQVQANEHAFPPSMRRAAAHVR
jgi:hypothetical protein